jgi:hypothetical protein
MILLRLFNLYIFGKISPAMAAICRIEIRRCAGLDVQRIGCYNEEKKEDLSFNNLYVEHIINSAIN